jgi:hypothetical protein
VVNSLFSSTIFCLVNRRLKSNVFHWPGGSGARSIANRVNPLFLQDLLGLRLAAEAALHQVSEVHHHALNLLPSGSPHHKSFFISTSLRSMHDYDVCTTLIQLLLSS